MVVHRKSRCDNYECGLSVPFKGCSFLRVLLVEIVVEVPMLTEALFLYLHLMLFWQPVDDADSQV